MSNTQDTHQGLPIVKTKRDVVGGIRFDRVIFRIKGDGELYETPAMALHFDMLSGEQRRPVLITPEMVFPIIANLSTWGAMVSGSGVDLGDAPEEEDPTVIDPTAPVNELARQDGESRVEWDARVRAIVEARG